MNYLLIYVNFIDQIIVNRDKYEDQCDIVLESFVPKVVPQPWMTPILILVFLTIAKLLLHNVYYTIFSKCTRNNLMNIHPFHMKISMVCTILDD